MQFLIIANFFNQFNMIEIVVKMLAGDFCIIF